MKTNNALNISKLKIKLKSLAAEAKIIRKEELKNKGTNWSFKAESFHFHRINRIRPIARATHIAYGLLRGLPLHAIEASSKSEPDWATVTEMVRRYSASADRSTNLAVLNSWETKIGEYDLAA